MKRKWLSPLLTLALLSLTSFLWALEAPPQPQKCPEVSAIQAGRFYTARPFKDGNYAALQLSNYNTSNSWVFAIVGIPATGPVEAIVKARAALNTLSFAGGPDYLSQNNVWACYYAIGSGYQAFALTPLPSEAIDVQALVKGLR